MISKRLQVCADYTKGFHELADIGTDHALIPIYCVTKGFVKQAIAVDNKKGPLEIAQKNITNFNLKEEIKLVLSDGLSAIDSADVVLIAGIGGILTKQILDNGKDKLLKVKRIILAPNNDSMLVRQWAMENDFVIIDEDVVYDGNHFYEIIVLSHGTASLSKWELNYGPILLQKRPNDFLSMLQKKLVAFNKISEFLNEEKKQQKEWIEKFLSQYANKETH